MIIVQSIAVHSVVFLMGMGKEMRVEVVDSVNDPGRSGVKGVFHQGLDILCPYSHRRQTL